MTVDVVLIVAFVRLCLHVAVLTCERNGGYGSGGGGDKYGGCGREAFIFSRSRARHFMVSVVVMKVGDEG